MIKRVAITGPESTGKSVLTKQLAEHFNTLFVPEYAREYIAKLNRPYNENDIMKIAKGHFEREEEKAKYANEFLFVDTEFLVTKIWSLHKYKTCDECIQDKFNNHVYDLYLLMDIDMPWQQDPQREHPHLRQFFFDWYYTELKNKNFTFEVVKGTGEKRLHNAIKIIESHFP